LFSELSGWKYSMASSGNRTERNRQPAVALPKNIEVNLHLARSESSATITEDHDRALHDLLLSTDETKQRAKKKIQEEQKSLAASLVQAKTVSTNPPEVLWRQRNVVQQYDGLPNPKLFFTDPLKWFPYESVDGKKPWDFLKRWILDNFQVRNKTLSTQRQYLQEIEYNLRSRLPSWLSRGWFDDQQHFQDNLYPLGYTEKKFSGLELPLTVEAEVSDMSIMEKKEFPVWKREHIRKFVQQNADSLFYRTVNPFRRDEVVYEAEEEGGEEKKIRHYTAADTYSLLLFHFLLEANRRKLKHVPAAYKQDLVLHIGREGWSAGQPPNAKGKGDAIISSVPVPTDLKYTSEQISTIVSELKALGKKGSRVLKEIFPLEKEQQTQQLMWSSSDVSVQAAAFGIDVFKVSPFIFAGNKLLLQLDVVSQERKAAQMFWQTELNNRNRYFALCFETWDSVLFPIVRNGTTEEGQPKISIFEYERGQGEIAHANLGPIHLAHSAVSTIFENINRPFVAPFDSEQGEDEGEDEGGDEGGDEGEDEGEDEGGDEGEDEGEDEGNSQQKVKNSCEKNWLLQQLDTELKQSIHRDPNVEKYGYLHGSILSLLRPGGQSPAASDLFENVPNAETQQVLSKLREVETTWLRSKVSGRGAIAGHGFVSRDQTVLDIVLVHYLKKLAGECHKIKGTAFDLRPVLHAKDVHGTWNKRTNVYFQKLDQFQKACQASLLIFDPGLVCNVSGIPGLHTFCAATGKEQMYLVAMMLFLHRLSSEKTLPAEITLSIVRNPGTEAGKPKLLFTQGKPHIFTQRNEKAVRTPSSLQWTLQENINGTNLPILVQKWSFDSAEVVANFGRAVVANFVDEILCSNKFVAEHFFSSEAAVIRGLQSLAAYNDKAKSRVFRKGQKNLEKDGQHFATVSRWFREQRYKKRNKKDFWDSLEQKLISALMDQRKENRFKFPEERQLDTKKDLQLFSESGLKELYQFSRSVYWTQHFCLILNDCFLQSARYIRQQSRRSEDKNQWDNIVACTLAEIMSTWFCNFLCVAQQTREKHLWIVQTWRLSFVCILLKTILKTVTLDWFWKKKVLRGKEPESNFHDVFRDRSNRPHQDWYRRFHSALKTFISSVFSSLDWKVFCNTESVEFEFVQRDTDTSSPSTLDSNRATDGAVLDQKFMNFLHTEWINIIDRDNPNLPRLDSFMDRFLNVVKDTVIDARTVDQLNNVLDSSSVRLPEDFAAELHKFAERLSSRRRRTNEQEVTDGKNKEKGSDGNGSGDDEEKSSVYAHDGEGLNRDEVHESKEENSSDEDKENSSDGDVTPAPDLVPTTDGGGKPQHPLEPVPSPEDERSGELLYPLEPVQSPEERRNNGRQRELQFGGHEQDDKSKEDRTNNSSDFPDIFKLGEDENVFNIYVPDKNNPENEIEKQVFRFEFNNEVKYVELPLLDYDDSKDIEVFYKKELSLNEPQTSSPTVFDSTWMSFGTVRKASKIIRDRIYLEQDRDDENIGTILDDTQRNAPNQKIKVLRVDSSDKTVYVPLPLPVNIKSSKSWVTTYGTEDSKDDVPVKDDRTVEKDWVRTYQEESTDGPILQKSLSLLRPIFEGSEVLQERYRTETNRRQIEQEIEQEQEEKRRREQRELSSIEIPPFVWESDGNDSPIGETEQEQEEKQSTTLLLSDDDDDSATDETEQYEQEENEHAFWTDNDRTGDDNNSLIDGDSLIDDVPKSKKFFEFFK
jgi:hypothetical protein